MGRGPVVLGTISALLTSRPRRAPTPSIPISDKHGSQGKGAQDQLGYCHLLSSRVLCSALSVRTFTFSAELRGRRGVIRLTAAVLRKRLALPRVGELSQPGLGRGSAPPIARACMGRCGREEARRHSAPLDLARAPISPAGLAGFPGLGRQERASPPPARDLPGWAGRTLADSPPPVFPTEEKPKSGPSACPYRGTWAAAGAGSSSSSRSSMVAA